MNYNFDHSKLLGRLRELHITQSKLAEKLKISETALNAKLKGKTDFKQSEIKQISDCLHIPMCDLNHYFFYTKS